MVFFRKDPESGENISSPVAFLATKKHIIHKKDNQLNRVTWSPGKMLIQAQKYQWRHQAPLVRIRHLDKVLSPSIDILISDN